jgi:hypothetical protein
VAPKRLRCERRSAAGHEAGRTACIIIHIWPRSAAIVHLAERRRRPGPNKLAPINLFGGGAREQII